MKLRKFSLFFVVVIVSHMLLVVECSKQRNGKKRERGRNPVHQQRDEGKTENPQDEHNAKKDQSKGKPALKGKFSGKDKTHCTWAVTEGDIVSLRVTCKKEESNYWCEFTGKPSTCHQYATNQKSYWKQIGRALKKQKSLCESPKSVLKSNVCKRGPPDAHLKLSSSSLLATEDQSSTKASNKNAHQKAKIPVVVGVTEAPKNTSHCNNDADQRKAAEEYCGEKWSSLCRFFITMLQSESC
uniref:Fibroblast growth factor binding protein 1 n=1 Tax=Latimeria chalumnae TaxID=7897 RepID=H3A7P9_LATCH|nr:PREDICTED: fibroblast growth factor-binding protein 1 [Latimeria chalumnae]|eukprot:XP_006011061.1 PREDICTED: fibroblast growth factor-binding protein 1 [Latimeria chalumnae]